MIENFERKPQWQRRLTIARGLHKEKSETIGEDIGVLSYRTMMSLGTERRVQILCTGEPLIEIHQDDKDWINVEVQGISCRGVRVILSPVEGQSVEDRSISPDGKRVFVIE